MKKNSKKIIISIFVFFIIILLSISVIIAENTLNKKKFEIDKEKIYYEINYLESQIIYMINSLNNTNREQSFYINWQELQKNSRKLYAYWNSTILDFNNLNIDKRYLTDFSKDLDTLIVSINTNEKNKTINSLLSLYNKLIIYSNSMNFTNYSLVLTTKMNLLTAASIVESKNWTLVHEYILKASESITNIVNKMENNQYNQYNINQAYIAIKELENLINIKDLEIFHFKYNIAIENIKKIKTGEVS